MTENETKSKNSIELPEYSDLSVVNDSKKDLDVLYSNDKYFPETLSRLQVGNEHFFLVTGTSTCRIQTSGKIYVFNDIKSFTGKGFHICKMVKSDVMKFIEDNPDYEYTTKELIDRDLNHVNHDECVKSIGKSVFAVDINDCYWDTIFKLGFITQKTYLNGLKKKEWKTGRNSSIGSLKKDEWVTEYKGSTIIERKPAYNDPRVVAIRTEVRSYVHSMFKELMELLDNRYLMYFTDCLYVGEYKDALTCMKFFESKGYGSKINVYEIDKIENSAVYWHDYKKNIAKFRKYGVEADGLTYTIGAGNKIKANTSF